MSIKFLYHKSLHYTLHVNSFQLDSVGPGLPGRHPEPGSPASLLPSGDGAGPGRVLGPHPHRVHHWGLGPRHQGRQGQLQQPGAQVLNHEVLWEEDELSFHFHALNVLYRG